MPLKQQLFLFEPPYLSARPLFSTIVCCTVQGEINNTSSQNRQFNFCFFIDNSDVVLKCSKHENNI